MGTLSVKLPEFKRMAKELVDLSAMPNTKLEEVQNGVKCLGIAYLNLDEDPDHFNTQIAAMVYRATTLHLMEQGFQI